MPTRAPVHFPDLPRRIARARPVGQMSLTLLSSSTNLVFYFVEQVYTSFKGKENTMATYLALLSAEVHDATGVPASALEYVDVPDTVTVAQLASLVQAYSAVLDPLTDAQIDRIFVKLDLPFSGAKSSPVAGSIVERTMLANWEQSSSVYKFGVDVPAVTANIIGTDGRIDTTNPIFTNWTAFLLAAHTGITFVSKFALALLRVIDVLISFRKHRKQEQRRTIETP